MWTRGDSSPPIRNTIHAPESRVAPRADFAARDATPGGRFEKVQSMFRVRKRPYAALEDAFGYRFRNSGLLEMALIHRSHRFENLAEQRDNQRLEFLGDAVLGFLAAEFVYRSHEEQDEGKLTAFRSQTTSGRALARVAREIDLGDQLLMGRGEVKTGGRDRDSNLADAVESILGAAYLDGGLKAARRVFQMLIVPQLEALSGDVWAGNPKGKLQDVAQRLFRLSPVYTVIKERGPAHARSFEVEVRIQDKHRAVGTGSNKRTAQAAAARKLLAVLEALEMAEDGEQEG